MPKVTNLLIADSIREEKTGKFVFLGVYVDVELMEKPDPADVFVLVMVDHLDVGDHELFIRIVDRTAKRSAKSSSTSITITEDGEKFVNIMQMPNFSFPSSGVYSLIANVDGQDLSRYDFRISFPNEEKD